MGIFDAGGHKKTENTPGAREKGRAWASGCPCGDIPMHIRTGSPPISAYGDARQAPRPIKPLQSPYEPTYCGGLFSVTDNEKQKQGKTRRGQRKKLEKPKKPSPFHSQSTPPVPPAHGASTAKRSTFTLLTGHNRGGIPQDELRAATSPWRITTIPSPMGTPRNRQKSHRHGPIATPRQKKRPWAKGSKGRADPMPPFRTAFTYSTPRPKTRTGIFQHRASPLLPKKPAGPFKAPPQSKSKGSASSIDPWRFVADDRPKPYIVFSAASGGRTSSNAGRPASSSKKSQLTLPDSKKPGRTGASPGHSPPPKVFACLNR